MVAVNYTVLNRAGFYDAVAPAIVRPANTVAYSIGQALAQSTVVGSCAPGTISLAVKGKGQGGGLDAAIKRVRVRKNTTSVAAFATANVQMATNPTAAQTLTLNGTVITFVASGATGNQVNIGGSATITAASLLAFLQTATDPQLVKFTYAAGSPSTTLLLTAAQAGTAGNSLTVATNVTGAVVSGSPLSGGAGPVFRVHFFNTAPTGFAADGASFAANNAGYIGAVDVAPSQAFLDGALGVGTANVGPEMVFNLPTKSTTLYFLLEMRSAYTPASGETFTVEIEVNR